MEPEDNFLDPDLETKDSTMESEVKATVRRIFCGHYPHPIDIMEFCHASVAIFRPFWIPPSRFALKATQSQPLWTSRSFTFAPIFVHRRLGENTRPYWSGARPVACVVLDPRMACCSCGWQTLQPLTTHFQCAIFLNEELKTMLDKAWSTIVSGWALEKDGEDSS